MNIRELIKECKSISPIDKLKLVRSLLSNNYNYRDVWFVVNKEITEIEEHDIKMKQSAQNKTTLVYFDDSSDVHSSQLD